MASGQQPVCVVFLTDTVIVYNVVVSEWEYIIIGRQINYP